MFSIYWFIFNFSSFYEDYLEIVFNLIVFIIGVDFLNLKYDVVIMCEDFSSFWV